ncbi:type 1 glutamine amidotransferase domain-containing protein [Cutibacterium avidum]|uniref:Type 1 glutamine amidotransferase domain-containing protein n=1 Tax=Cutibacterium avidum TaxID=33010 RepID=A0A3E2DE28_9ACTN|nr:type 1 glutamine amidotransferase domain-containing protein [Cutibacterium avidum]MBS5745796.1 type 1 glutamine amidotransferase domain-containing protein [Propionibacterium sp.]MDU7817444.1 type 1 glutamine amidotransferase domain-containing protein [Bacillota bacterium]MDK7359032.1 type 1 glutamine amidotransferase domain-containing protein [Cutibacterium avidum]MDK7372830.1 type 1 glutamine amidotransferase domain-containing protein [Cutibacterium avidum]MDU2072903.1 type 1 glutamine ami
MARILMVLTSHDQLGDTDRKTGFWLEEFAAPYYVFGDAGHEITLASPKGGQPPVDPTSALPQMQTDATRRFEADDAAKAALAATVRLSEVDPAQFDAVFYPGGHGPLWDLVDDPASKQIILDSDAAGRPLGLVCHAPGVLHAVKKQDGTSLIVDRSVTGFTNGEEEAAGLTSVVPFLVEDSLTEAGARYSKGADGESYVVTDGTLVTGQNPASSADAAQRLLDLLTH